MYVCMYIYIYIYIYIYTYTYIYIIGPPLKSAGSTAPGPSSLGARAGRSSRGKSVGSLQKGFQ